MRGVRFAPERNARDRVCGPEEYQRLVAAADPELRLVILLGYWTAMRLGEIAALTWDRVDLKRRSVRLETGHTKTGHGRKVPLSAEAVEALKQHPRRMDGAVFEHSAGTLSPRFARLTRQLGIEDLRFHDLRHTAATRLRRAGVDVMTIQEITGHKSLAMLKRYQTTTEEDLRAAMERAEAVK